MIDVSSTFKIAMKSLRINKMRSMLTSLGIIIGVSAVIIMLAVGAGASKRITDELSSMGSNLLTVRSGSSTSGGLRMGAGTQPTLTMKDAAAIEKNCPAALYVSPYTREAKQVTYSNQNWSTSIAGIAPSYIEIADWKILNGRGFTDEDINNSSKVALIGNTVAINLFGDLDPLEKTIRIGGIPFKIVGLLDSKGQMSMGMDQDDIIMIPITTAQKRVFGTNFPGTIQSIEVKAVSPEAVTDAEEQITELLHVRHRIGKNQEDDFRIRNMTEIINSMKETTKVMSILLGAIASVSLLVGGIGIMNIMLVSVTERTKEIGIRMAIGATTIDIRVQFLIEALMLSIAGGLIGVATGLLVSKSIATFSDTSILVTPFSIILSLGFSAFIGVVFGYYPAHKASLLNPIDALRYE